MSLLCIQPGKPDQNAYIERFNRSYQAGVFNAHLFESIAELRVLTDAWLQVSNQERPATASTECRPSRLCQGRQVPDCLPENCPLDGGAYEPTRAIERFLVRHFATSRVL